MKGNEQCTERSEQRRGQPEHTAPRRSRRADAAAPAALPPGSTAEVLGTRRPFRCSAWPFCTSSPPSTSPCPRSSCRCWCAATGPACSCLRAAVRERQGAGGGFRTVLGCLHACIYHLPHQTRVCHQPPQGRQAACLLAHHLQTPHPGSRSSGAAGRFRRGPHTSAGGRQQGAEQADEKAGQPTHMACISAQRE